jgi:hypothetical protein
MNARGLWRKWKNYYFQDLNICNRKHMADLGFSIVVWSIITVVFYQAASAAPSFTPAASTVVALEEHPYEGPPCWDKYQGATPSTAQAGTPSAENYVVEYLPLGGGERWF